VSGVFVLAVGCKPVASVRGVSVWASRPCAWAWGIWARGILVAVCIVELAGLEAIANV
jgi:hypothetical protein